MMGWHKRCGAQSVLRQLGMPKEIGQLIASYLTVPVTIGLYIGEMKNEQRKISEEKDIILGTYKLASVGMDIPALNTLVMASPRKEIEQSVGRILRKQKSEAGFSPLIYDIIDNHGVFKSQARERKKFYGQYGYTVVHLQMLCDGTILSKRTVKGKDGTEGECESPDKAKVAKAAPKRLSATKGRIAKAVPKCDDFGDNGTGSGSDNEECLF
jgi:superfamily II DNA or RNA helicase